MLFNSGLFLQFFAAFLLLYYVVRNHLHARNILIVVASYIFYGAWDYRFLVLLAFSSIFDFYIGLNLDRLTDPVKRKRLLVASIFLNLAILGFFKYYNFFVDSFADLSRAFGFQPNLPTLQIILPVGISFYTFQSMSYALDVYRWELPATRNLIHFLAFVSFFPQLVAGPIERARHLLPQFAETRVITVPMLREGLWLCIWGMFKKVVIADSLAPLVEMVYGNGTSTGPMVILGTIAFALQIYGDFSGYSDIARGTALVLGFDIMLNFNLPYTATSMREFWQRWHISLSTWLRDYLYIPLGGNRRGPARTKINLMLTMLLGGLWHGARWNFVLWGLWHGLALIAVGRGSRRSRTSGGRASPRAAPTNNLLPPVGIIPPAENGSRGRSPSHTAHPFRALPWLLTMFIVLYGWLLFRADSFRHIVTLHTAFAHWTAPGYFANYLLYLTIFTLPLAIMEILQRRAVGPLTPLTWRPATLGILQGLLLICILIFWEKDKVPFIYFQF
jgi:alginate O-acetyltransferase complex protein AlgI